MIQTDNGAEFTNALLVTKSRHKTLFEEALIEMGIEYRRIRIATPRHNGKVERQHRTDEQRFYRHMRMYSLADGRKQLAVYQRESNNHMAVFKIFCKEGTVTRKRFPEPEVVTHGKRRTQPPRQRPGLGRLPGKC